MENEPVTDITSRSSGDVQQDESAQSPEDNGKKGEKKLGTNRGVETLFRTNYDNHIQLSQLADNKANTLISINGLIISILIAMIAPRFDSFAWTILPVLILLIGCMTSLIFSVIASRPRVTQTPLTLEEVRNNRGNILFFGIFTRLKVEEFEEGMHELLRDREILYDNMIRDLHSMGNVLRKKYYFLSFAYAAFLITLVLSVVTFLGVFIGSG